MFPDLRCTTRKERLSLEGPKPLLDTCGDKAHWNFLLSVQHQQHPLFQVLTQCNESTPVRYTEGVQGLKVATDTGWMEQGLELLLPRKTRGITE